MSLFDRIKKSFKSNTEDNDKNKQNQENPSISDEDVLQAFRKACWDLYISNLPDPVVVNTSVDKKYKDLPDEFRNAVPRGFFIDTRTWTTYFNSQDIPKQITDVDVQKEYAKSIFQHESTHFLQVPADNITEAILVDSALKGLKDQSILNDKEKSAAYAYLTMNIMGDLIGDTLLGKENYGREDFGDLTKWRMQETIKMARETQQDSSTLWQTIVRAYEKLWDEDLGLKNLVKKISPDAEKTAQELVNILGNDWKDRSTLENKIKKFAGVLEQTIKKSEQEAQNQQNKSRFGQGQGKGQGLKGQNKSQQRGSDSGQGNGNEQDENQHGGSGGGGRNKQNNYKNNSVSLPDDIIIQMGESPAQSPIGSDKNKKPKGKHRSNTNTGAQKHGDEEREDEGSDELDERILEELYSRNQNSPQKFAGTLGALYALDADDALRFMYRTRARELLMKIKEKRNQRAERTPSYQTTWQIGDKLLGKGGLEIVPSMMRSGKPIPGLTTYKRKLEVSEGHGRMKMIPDIFIEIDSSGSMTWNPWADQPEARGDFDKAVLAAEGAALYAVDNGGRVAVINFSGQGDVAKQDYTTRMDEIERAIMKHYNGGTVVPTNETCDMIKKTKNPLLTCLMSDCELSNPDEACERAFAYGITEHDSVVIFKNGQGGQSFANKIKQKGASIYTINKIEDLFGIIIGQIKKLYDDENEQEGGADKNASFP